MSDLLYEPAEVVVPAAAIADRMPTLAQEIVQAVKNECGHLPPTAQRPVILTSMDIRRYVRKLLEYEFNPPFSVVSYQELSPELNIQPVARISTR